MGEPYLLAGRAWLPVATAAGRREFIRIRDIARPDVLRIDTGRPDCDISVTEFLIGLLAISALAPREKRDWKERFHNPPSPEETDEAIAPFAHALVLDGPGPRFFQDFEPLERKVFSVSSLLPDAPGVETLKDNKDLFVKRGRTQILSRNGAAVALLTLQTIAPSGGSGHRTSLRGGGPATTLIIPRASKRAPSFWEILWANVPAGFRCDPQELPKAMPWLLPTRCSENDEPTTPEDVHKSQAFFGMPRRIRLFFRENVSRTACDILGIADEWVVDSYATRPRGTNYIAWSRSHPLSPYYKPKQQATEYLPVHFSESTVGYNQWTGLALKYQDGLRVPSDNVAVFLNERRRDAGISAGNEYKAGILACGYAMDNMKPLDFTEAYLPIIVTETEDGDRELAIRASEMVKAANYAVSMLAQTLNAALFGGQGKAGTSLLDGARARFWSSTEDEFFAALRKFARDADQDPRAEWLCFLRGKALAIFDGLAPVDAPESLDIKNVVQARSLLLRALSGKKFFAEAGLPPPEKDKPKRRAA